MAQASEPAVQCQSCGADSFSVGQHDVPHCDYCGQPLAPSGGHCPRCGEESEPDARTCGVCGALLALPCPVCGALNPLGAQDCIVCTQTLATSDALFQRITTRTEDQLRRARDRGHRIKAKEEIASQTRLARMWTEEERAREAVAEAKARQHRRERHIIIAAIILVGVSILVVLMLSLLSGPNLSPTPCPLG